jgi:hypothetical protein
MALSLNLMDRTVEVMRNCVVDDVHLSNRFSNFLEVITNRLRPMIVRMSRTATAANNKNISSPAGNNNNNNNTRNSRKTNEQQQQPLNATVTTTTTRAASSSGSVPVYSMPFSNAFDNNTLDQNNNNNNHMNSPSAHHNNNNNNLTSLYGIPTQAYDINASTSGTQPPFTIMPPPTTSNTALNSPLSSSLLHQHQQNQNQNQNNLPNHSNEEIYPFSTSSTTGFDDGGNGNNGGADAAIYDWLALPLDPILAANGQDVNGSCFGVGIGEFDLLEVLLGGGGGNGDGFGGNGGHGL